MKNTLLAIFLLTSFSAFSSEQVAATAIIGQEAEAMFNELNGSSEYSAGAITDFIEYRIVVRSKDNVQCQKATTLYKAINQTEIEFECTIQSL